MIHFHMAHFPVHDAIFSVRIACAWPLKTDCIYMIRYSTIQPLKKTNDKRIEE